MLLPLSDNVQAALQFDKVNAKIVFNISKNILFVGLDKCNWQNDSMYACEGVNSSHYILTPQYFEIDQVEVSNRE